MKNYILVILMAMLYLPLKAQHILKVKLKDEITKEPLPGAIARVAGTMNATAADENGALTLTHIPEGQQLIQFNFVGYEEKMDTLIFPQMDTLTVYLTPESDELDEIVVSSTRSSRTIHDIPSRMEFIAGEELEEKGNMKPGDIRMVLAESTGIQTQQTSATSANSSIRIQGLDGRYTQILKDGFPLYAGYAGGLGLLQTPPLDLKQIEVFKGSASTLYGGGAISGLVNLISKTPGHQKEMRFIVNGTSAGGLDVSGFYSKQWNKMGLTLFAARNSNIAYDPAKNGFSAIPQFERYTLNPKLFFNLSKRTAVIVGLNMNLEDRIGGDMKFIEGHGDSTHRYFEENKSQRISTQLSIEHKFGTCSHLTFKNSVSTFKRFIAIPDYTFDGRQNASYTEVSYSSHADKMEWVAGLNLVTDQFLESRVDTFPLRNYTQLVYGAFIQNTSKITNWLHIESGLRLDHVIDYTPVLLPRLSLLFKLSPKVTSRLGGGFGYKAPTIFTEESERIQYKNLLPIDGRNVLEKSYGCNGDMNYRTVLFDNQLTFTINQLFFYTFLNQPLTLINESNGTTRLINSNGHIDSKGAETNMKLGYKNFKLFLGYTYTDTKNHMDNISYIKTLTSKNRINSVLMYEVEEKWKLGLEAYYYSPQLLSDGATGRDYWLCGFMIERIWERLSVYINFENFLDSRQTRFSPIYTGPPTNPIFKDIYAPLDGFVVNGGLKIKL